LRPAWRNIPQPQRRAPAAARPKVEAKGFYYWFSAAFAVSALLGFTPSYWGPLAAGKPVFNPVVHLHGALFFGWALYFFYQTNLIADRKLLRHRAMGMLGVAWAAALCILGVLVSLNTLLNAEAAGFGPLGEEVVVVPLSSITGFTILITLAFTNTHRPELHRRLMVLSTIAVLDAPWARLTRPLVAWACPALGLGPASPWLGIVLSFACADVFLVAAIVHDWIRNGRPHRAYVIGGLAIVAVQYGRLAVVDTAPWRAIVHAFLGLTGAFPEPHV